MLETRRGFGVSMIEQLATAYLDGAGQFHFERDGLRVTISSR